jgi:hypothetical protein
MLYIFPIKCQAVQESNTAIPLQKDGATYSQCGFQQHQKGIDSILHHLQEGQEIGKLL